MIKRYAKSWWKWLKYEPNDPRFCAGGVIKITVIGGGTGLSNLLRGLKKYSNQISAIVTVADGGGSTGKLREEFDMLAPGDIRQCISALAHDEDLFSDLFEHRFSNDKKILGGHTLGNIWITALTDPLHPACNCQYSNCYCKQDDNSYYNKKPSLFHITLHLLCQ
jgi:hypothetical protein